MKKKLIVGLASAMLAGTFVSATSFAAETDYQANVQDVKAKLARLAELTDKLENKETGLYAKRAKAVAELDTNKIAMDKMIHNAKANLAAGQAELAKLEKALGADFFLAASKAITGDVESVRQEKIKVKAAELESAAKVAWGNQALLNKGLEATVAAKETEKANLVKAGEAMIKGIDAEIAKVKFERATIKAKLNPKMLEEANKQQAKAEKEGTTGATAGKDAKATEGTKDAKAGKTEGTKAAKGTKALAKTGVATSGVALGGLVALAAAVMLRRRAK